MRYFLSNLNLIGLHLHDPLIHLLNRQVRLPNVFYKISNSMTKVRSLMMSFKERKQYEEEEQGYRDIYKHFRLGKEEVIKLIIMW
jgi:hypothetical protein